MFITVSVGGMLAVTATAAATGVVTGLYIRVKTVNVIDRLKGAMGRVNQSSFVSRWTKGSTPGSTTPPTK
jgi:hypothetical protein